MTGSADAEIVFPSTPFPLEPSLVLLGRRGSEAHGTYVPPTEPDAIDDRDLMGICIPPARFYLGFREWNGAEAINGPWDVVLYEYRKFVSLLMKQNPNVLGMLWLVPEDYLYIGPLGALLIELRDLFRHRKRAYDAFTGYAHSQLIKMRKSEFAGYMGARRKALVQKHGYDTKNAAHLIRLLHMGEEYLRTGELTVRRTTDRELLLDVKRGAWSLERVQEYAVERLARCETAYMESVLPETIDEERLDGMVTEILRGAMR